MRKEPAAAPRGPAPSPATDAASRARALVARMELAEKLRCMHSRMGAVPRLGLREFHIGGEAAHGFVAKDGHATLFPQTIGMSCTWDPELLLAAGRAVGDEARAYYRKRGGLSGLAPFAPTIDLERDARWGRTEEAYGEDPCLAATLSSAYIRGMRGENPGRIKCLPVVKHFYANNNEEDRGSFSASLDERARREYYLRPFEAAVASGPVALMTAYNAVNGVPAMLLRDIGETLRGEWGMRGFVVCDGGALELLVREHKVGPGAAEAAALAVKAGIDNFTDEEELVEGALAEAVERGLLAESDLDRALERVIECRIMLGQLDGPGDDPYADIGEEALWNRGHAELALRAARESVVLLKNADTGAGPLLPLRAESSVALVGPLADSAMLDWYGASPAWHATPLQALGRILPQGQLRYARGSSLVSFRHRDGRPLKVKSWFDGRLSPRGGPDEEGERFILDDWCEGNQTLRSCASGYYLSTATGKLSLSSKEVWGWFIKERFAIEPAGAGLVRLRAWNGDAIALGPDGFLAAIPGAEPEPLALERLSDGFEEAAAAAASCERAVVFVGNHPLLGAKEEIDRKAIELPPYQEALARAVLRANPNSVLAVVSGYPIALGPLADEFPAIVYMAHGGQEGGEALAEALVGRVNPGGKLSMTWPASTADLPPIKDYALRLPGRTYMYSKAAPLYPFGHGLSYARFSYSGIVAEALADGAAAVAFDVENAGPGAGDEVCQLYVATPDSAVVRPALELAGFRRLSLAPGERRRVEMRLEARSFRCWDMASSSWRVERGRRDILVGSSSADIRLRASIVIEGAELAPRRLTDWTEARLFDEGEGFAVGADAAGTWVGALREGAWIGFRADGSRKGPTLELDGEGGTPEMGTGDSVLRVRLREGAKLRRVRVARAEEGER